MHEKDPRIGLPARYTRYTRYTGHDVGGEDEETVAAAASGDAAAGDGGDGGDGGDVAATEQGACYGRTHVKQRMSSNACQARCVKLAELRVGERMSSKVCQAGGAARRRRGRLLTPGS